MRGYWLWIGLGLAGLLVLFIFFRFHTSGKTSAQAELQRKRLSRFDDPTLEIKELAKNADVPFTRVLSDFRDWAQYPPESRPLRLEDTDQIRFEKIALPMQPMPVVEDGKPKEPLHSCVLQAESHTAYEDTTHETKLRCQNLASGKFVMPDIRAIKLTRTAAAAMFSAPPPDTVKTDTPPHITFQFKPRKQDWGDMELTVDFALPDERTSFIHQLKTHFFSSPQAPAKFTGRLQERIEKGSLVILAELEVRLAGQYRLEANLFAADENPVGHARADVALAGGTQWVELLFFGKVLRDARKGGPYKLTGLRGEQTNLPIRAEDLTLPPDQVARILAATEQNEPIKRAILPWLGEYRTEPYPLERFSDAEYDSDFKRERLAQLEKLAAAQ